MSRALNLVPDDLTPWQDSLGLVCFQGRSKDGGDTLANELTIAYCAHLANIPYDVNQKLSLLWANKVPVRHPNPEKWYSQPDRLSRDQFTPLLIYLSAAKHPRLQELLNLHRENYFALTWNTKRNFVYPTELEHSQKSTPDVPWNYASKLPDITALDIWAIELRATLLGTKQKLFIPLFYPILCLLDLQGLLGAFVSRLQHCSQAGPYDGRNITLKTHFCATHLATPISLLAALIWSKKMAVSAAFSFWTQPGEPPVHTYIRLLNWPTLGSKLQSLVQKCF